MPKTLRLVTIQGQKYMTCSGMGSVHISNCALRQIRSCSATCGQGNRGGFFMTRSVGAIIIFEDVVI